MWRDEANALVQRIATLVWRGEGDFLGLSKADKDADHASSRGCSTFAVT